MLLPLLLGACLAQSDIQAHYMSQESSCHSEAQEKVSSSGSGKDSTLVAGTAFSECMNRQGWKVATPKKPNDTTTTASTTPPIGPSTSGGIPGGTASGAAARPSPAQAAQNPNTLPAAPILGPGVQPDPAPAREAVAPAVQAAPSMPVTSMPVAPPSASTSRVSPPTPRMPTQPPPMNEAPSTYQPAEPYTTPSYGSGAGRNF